MNQAAKYSNRLIAVNQGRIVKQGAPKEVFDADLFRDVFSIEANIHMNGDIPFFSREPEYTLLDLIESNRSKATI